MTNKSIDRIVSHINRNYPAKPYNYEVRILGGNQGVVPDAPADVMFNCSSVTLPGGNMSITQNRRYTLGQPNQLPTGKFFTEVTLGFYESEYEKEKRYFSEWMNKIYDKNSKTFEFYRNFVKNIQVIQYDRQGKITYECLMIDCFPSNISPLDKSYGATDQVAQFNVGLQFYDMQEKFYDNRGLTGISWLDNLL